MAIKVRIIWVCDQCGQELPEALPREAKTDGSGTGTFAMKCSDWHLCEQCCKKKLEELIKSGKASSTIIADVDVYGILGR